FPVILLCLTVSFYAGAQAYSAASSVDWTQFNFSSQVQLNIEQAGIILPSGRGAALERMNMQIPNLIKDPLLFLAADSSNRLGDLVLRDIITLEQLTRISDNGKKSPSIFADNGSILQMNHTVSLVEIASLMIKHNIPYTPQLPIERVSSRSYTGILIDARGLLPVQGEFVKDKTYPCLFPKIWDENMDLLYEKNMIDSNTAQKQGLVSYSSSIDETKFAGRIGTDPLRISARKVFGVYRTDPVISRADALKILSVPENRELLKQGKIVVLLDKDVLVHPVSAPEKTGSYYVTFREIQNFYYEKKLPDIITDSYKGIQITTHLNFIADSPQLLPEEQEHVDAIAELLLKHAQTNEYTIQIEGHTASVGKPTGEMNLSIERAQEIIRQLTGRGLDEKLFSYKGFGGTVPVGSNETEEGRAMNRRVEIIVTPKATYIQRAN
ncbi:MAG TPA: OmpA family protein, partial [Treponemataceae bacterium]|nr:OmpA family protein [Treponemataceae bacterium]